MSGKLRVYEVARDLGMDNKALVALLQSVGFSEVKNHMSTATTEMLDAIAARFNQAQAQVKVEESKRKEVHAAIELHKAEGEKAAKEARAREAAAEAPPPPPPAPLPQAQRPETRPRPPEARIVRWSRFARYNGEIAEKATAAYVDIARQHGLDPAQMALAFVNRQRFVASNLIGATTMAQLETNLRSAAVTLSEDVLKAIDREKPHMFPGVPTMYMAINNAPSLAKYNLRSLRGAISGAAPLPPASLD